MKRVESTVWGVSENVGRTLSQSCGSWVRARTPDGLNRRIKEALNTDSRTGYVVSAVLSGAGFAQGIGVLNPATGRDAKATRLRDECSWQRGRSLG